MSTDESMTTIYAALAQKAWDSNRARAAELTRLFEQWGLRGAGTTGQREQALAIAHSLRGSAGTFGHLEASRAAEEVMALVTQPEQDGERRQLALLMARIDACLAREPVLDD